MTLDELRRALREISAGIRRVAQRATVKTEDENDLRTLASSLDDVALEYTAHTKGGRR